MKPLFFFLLAFGLFTEASKATDDAELESYVFNALAKYQSAHDQIRSRGFVCFARGVRSYQPSIERRTSGRRIPTLMITCGRNGYQSYFLSTKMMAYGFSKENQGKGLLPVVKPVTTWKYELFTASRARVCSNPSEPPVEMSREEYFDKDSPFLSVLQKHDPFLDWLSPGEIDHPGLTRNTIQQLISNMRLVSVKDLSGGKIEATFHMRYPTMLQSHRIIFSRAHGDMPEEIESTVPESQGDALGRYVCVGRYQWRNHGAIWLPSSISYAHTVFSGSEALLNEGELECEWRLGGDIPRECFDFDSDDPRAPLGELFGFDCRAEADAAAVSVGETAVSRPTAFK